MIKADAYGCGIEQVAAALAKAGCETFFVANLAEARRARSVAREAVIYVLNGFLPAAGAGFAETYPRPMIGSMIELDEWDRSVAARDFPAARRCISTPA